MFCLVLFAANQVSAATWYASPSATAGAGSINDPWHLQTALTNISIVAGDTLYLRGGHYYGPGFQSTLQGTINNHVTVRSYPNEWAMVSDGIVGTLGTTLTSGTTANVIFTNFNLWPGGVVSIDSENVLLNSKVAVNTWNVVRGWNGTTAASHAPGTLAIPYGGYVIDNASNYVTYRDFEITSVMTTNRQATRGFYPAGGLGLESTGHGCRAINLIIHDTGHPGIGFWQQGEGGEINGCIGWGTGFYETTSDFPPGTPRGSWVYAQNVSGQAKIRNCISFDNMTSGMKVFGEVGPVRDFHYEQNICFQNGLTPIEIASGSSPQSNTWAQANVMLGTPTLSYVSPSNESQYVIGNTIVNGAFSVSEHTASTYTNNTVFTAKNAGANPDFFYTSTVFAKSSLNIVWDYNTYYLGDGASRFRWNFSTADVAATNSAGGGILAMKDDLGKSWQDWSGFDLHSVYATSWPTDYLRVQSFALDYDANRHFVGVVNTTPATSATLDLGANGFRAGDIYTLRDAQNYFTVIAQGVYSGSALTLPLNLTNIATLQGSVTNFVPEHTNVQQPGLFNAFVLDRTDGGGSIAQLNVGTLIIR